jgi:hypothetical protein
MDITGQCPLYSIFCGSGILILVCAAQSYKSSYEPKQRKLYFHIVQSIHVNPSKQNNKCVCVCVYISTDLTFKNSESYHKVYLWVLYDSQIKQQLFS